MVTLLDTPCRESPIRTGKGYGKHRNQQTLHRWVWEQVNGPIPEGKLVRHRCDNPPCFRYDHLLLGTVADNSADMMERGRGRGQFTADATHCRNGHEYTPETVYEGRGVRECKVCRREAQARYKERRCGR